MQPLEQSPKESKHTSLLHSDELVPGISADSLNSRPFLPYMIDQREYREKSESTDAPILHRDTAIQSYTPLSVVKPPSQSPCGLCDLCALRDLITESTEITCDPPPNNHVVDHLLCQCGLMVRIVAFMPFSAALMCAAAWARGTSHSLFAPETTFAPTFAPTPAPSYPFTTDNGHPPQQPNSEQDFLSRYQTYQNTYDSQEGPSHF